MLSGSPENWVTMNYSGKYFYRNINGKHSYTEAKQFCERSGAKLAEPLDEVDNQNLGLMFSEFEGTMADSAWIIPYLNSKICLHCKYIHTAIPNRELQGYYREIWVQGNSNYML